MTQSRSVLTDRAVISVLGPDARDFLQRVITTDMKALPEGGIKPGALLTPQGKIICDFLLHTHRDGVLIDIDASAAEALAKRLALYRLRARADIELRNDLAVIIGDGSPDPRSVHLPARCIGTTDIDMPRLANQDAAEIAAGVPAFGRDYDEAEVFPTDVNLDLHDGIGWKKGCFIGQEVLSRMKRRGTIRKRSVRVEAGTGLDAGDELTAGDTLLGVLSSASGSVAIGRIRTDRLEKAEGPVSVGPQAVSIHLPAMD